MGGGVKKPGDGVLGKAQGGGTSWKERPDDGGGSACVGGLFASRKRGESQSGGPSC